MNVFKQKPVSQKMYLSGYGVELAIKSTEYKALDDTQVKGQFLSVLEENENLEAHILLSLKVRFVWL